MPQSTLHHTCGLYGRIDCEEPMSTFKQPGLTVDYQCQEMKWQTSIMNPTKFVFFGIEQVVRVVNNAGISTSTLDVNIEMSPLFHCLDGHMVTMQT